MLTNGYNLLAKKVIHIAGPIVFVSLTKELEKDLADCYWNTLDLCLGNNIRSAVLCCISMCIHHLHHRGCHRRYALWK